MPEAEKDHAYEDAALVPATAEKVSLPPTEAERRKTRLDKAVKESDDERSERHAAELRTHLGVHFENIAKIHQDYPTPDMPYLSMTTDEQKRWNAKRNQIDMANRAYHLAIKRQCADHREEHIHVAKTIAAAVAKSV
jgi:hypothetical protein